MWLLEANTRALIEQAEGQNISPSVEKQAEMAASYEASMASAVPRIMSVAGDKAEIAVHGVLTKAPSFLAMIFGGGNTTYPEIRASIAAAEQDPDVSEIILDIDSSGGHFDGLFDVLGAIRSAKKPMKARVSDLAASAAYAIATQTDSIEANNKAARLGSVGVAATFKVSEGEVTITSTEAPEKRPDVTTEKGRADVRQGLLDPMHDIFVEAIAGGRSSATGESFTSARVNKDFGRGATLLAEEALKRGMIDSIADTGVSGGSAGASIEKVTSVEVKGASPSDNKNNKTTKGAEVKSMDLITLKAEHGATYAKAVKVGVEQERDRVTSHLVMGEASGDLKTAIAAVTGGEAMTETVKAKHFAAGMNKKAIEARSEDEPDVKVEPGSETPDAAADQVADAVCEGLGYDDKGGK